MITRLLELLLRDYVSFEKDGVVVLRREPPTLTSRTCNHVCQIPLHAPGCIVSKRLRSLSYLLSCSRFRVELIYRLRLTKESLFIVSNDFSAPGSDIPVWLLV
ncbi:hypothetical protein Rs2_07541 [Raphanus sativus]|nr:hypothetical protein Rs2_07541 [Raphanus sativus]